MARAPEQVVPCRACRNLRLWRGKSPSHSLQIRSTKAQIRLQMASLAPFVPSVDEHQPFVALMTQPSLCHDTLKPILEQLGRRAYEGRCFVLPPCGVVPTRQHRAKKLEWRGALR